MKQYKEYDEERLLEGDNIKKTYGFNNKYEDRISSMYSDQQLYKMAKERVKLKNAFIINLVAYVSVILFIAIGEGIQDAMELGAVWGVVVIIHGVVTTLKINSQRQIAREMKNIEDERNRR